METFNIGFETGGTAEIKANYYLIEEGILNFYERQEDKPIKLIYSANKGVWSCVGIKRS
jgi:hypothetical protein